MDASHTDKMLCEFKEFFFVVSQLFVQLALKQIRLVLLAMFLACFFKLHRAFRHLFRT